MRPEYISAVWFDGAVMNGVTTFHSFVLLIRQPCVSSRDRFMMLKRVSSVVIIPFDCFAHRATIVTVPVRDVPCQLSSACQWYVRDHCLVSP